MRARRLAGAETEADRGERMALDRDGPGGYGGDRVAGAAAVAGVGPEDGAACADRRPGEVKELLLLLARTAESVGARDQRSAGQISEVTHRLEGIATLEIWEIRASIERSAAELKISVERMKAESKQAIDQLKAEVTTYQTKLEKAEEIASRDVLTGLRSRLYALDQMERRIESGMRFCLAILDLNDFKRVNDAHGHVVGDELLKQFATELKTACRATDVIGRWGGDEFVLLLDCGEQEAGTQMDRLRKWVFGTYSVEGPAGPMKLKVDASIGLAEFRPGETLKKLLERADAAMYQDKAANRTATAIPMR